MASRRRAQSMYTSGPSPFSKEAMAAGRGGGGFADEKKNAMAARLGNMLGGGLMLPGMGPPPSLGRKPAPPVDEPEPDPARSASEGADEEQEPGKLVHLTKDRPLTPQNRRKSMRMSRPRSMSLSVSPLAKTNSMPNATLGGFLAPPGAAEPTKRSPLTQSLGSSGDGDVQLSVSAPAIAARDSSYDADQEPPPASTAIAVPVLVATEDEQHDETAE